DASSFSGQRVSHVHFPTAAFAPALVHAQKHVGPIASFGAARARVDAEDAVAFIVWAAQKRSQLECVEIAFEFCQLALQLLLQFKLRSFWLGFAELDER